MLVAYWVYALAAVPLIEPSIDLASSPQPNESELAEAAARPNRRLEELQGLFAPGSWELENPKILESEQFMLILRDYANLGEGKVELRPCTMVFLPHAAQAAPSERNRQAVVLQAPEGAVLQFDQPLDLRRAKVGRLVSGGLRGQITIYSDGKSPGPDDDLVAVTRDVTLTEARLFTPNSVEFRMGPNYGRGSEMQIRFLPGERISGGKRHGPNVAGIESFELRHLERLHLQIAGGLVPAEGRAAGNGPSEARSASEGRGQKATGKRSWPVEVACRGPFRFDLVQQVASFSDQVDVLQLQPDGPSDQLACELLAIYFARPRGAAASEAKGKADAAKADSAAPLDLQPRRIEARGTPVVVLSPSRDFHARAEQLAYDLWDGRILLEGGDEVFLRYGANEIHAPSLQYQPAADGRLGQAAAQGPGWLRGQMSSRSGQQVLARWNEQLRLRPHEQQHVISLTGGADLTFPGLGQLTAGEIHFWLLEATPTAASKQADLRPDRMLARQAVRLDSAQFSGMVDQLEVWFEPVEAPARPTGLAAGISAVQTMSRAAELAQQFPSGAWMVQRALPNAPSPLPAGEDRAVSPLPSGGGQGEGISSGPSAAAQHFQITGGLLQARVAIMGLQSELTELTVKGNVHFAETRTARPEEQPLVLSGDQVHVADGSKPTTVVTVIGNPAQVQARGLALSGSNINLNRGTNVLWIEGPGQMRVPLDRDLDGRPVRAAATLQVDWQDRMGFDGRTARFEESVVASLGHQRLQTPTLEVRFRRPVPFGQATAQTKPEPEEVVCRGGVLVESRSMDEDGPTSVERAELRDLTINLVSGATRAAGPGWMSTIRRGGANPLLELAPGRPRGAVPASVPGRAAPAWVGAGPPGLTPATDPDAAKLVYLLVRFQDSLVGNHQRRQMTFRDRIRAVYGPVDSWETVLDADRPDSLGPEAVLLTCDQLSVIDMPAPVGHQRAMELEAAGNTIVENRTFTARGARMTYSQAKALLVLEGDGRSGAELFRQPYPGGPRAQTSARKIYYWHKLDQLRVDDARSFDLGQMPPAGR